MRRIFPRTLAFLLAMLILLGTLTGCGGVFDPLGYLKNSIERTLRESLAGQILGVLLEAVQGGCVALDFDGTDLVTTLPDKAYLKMWLDAENERVAADGSLTLAGESFEAQVFASEREAAVVSPAFFGSNTLGVDFTTLEKDLKTSIFSNNSGTVFSVSEISSASASRISAIKNGTFSLLDETEDSLDTADEILDFFLEALSTYAVHTRHKTGGMVHISLDINNDSLSRALRATHEMVADDKSVTKYLTRIAATVDSIYSAATGVSGSVFSDEINYFLDGEADIDTLCLAIDEMKPFTFLLEARVRSFGMKVESLRAAVLQDNITLADLSWQLAEQGEENRMTFFLKGVSYELSYVVREDGFRNYFADWKLTRTTFFGEGGELDSEKLVTGTLQADKREKSYTLTLQSDGQTRAFSGEYLFEDDEIMLSVSDATVNGSQKKLSLSLQLKAEESVPEMPAYLNVVQMDVTRFMPIATRASATSAKFLALWVVADLTPRGVFGDVLKMVGMAA